MHNLCNLSYKKIIALLLATLILLPCKALAVDSFVITSQSVLDLNKDINLPDFSIGRVDAPVVIVEYASLTCPHCADFYQGTLPQLKEKYIDTGKVRLISREFAWDPYAMAGFVLSRCVSVVRHDAVISKFYTHQAEWLQGSPQHIRDYLFEVAAENGLDTNSAKSCLQNSELIRAIGTGIENAQAKLGVNATPTFFINGVKYTGDLKFSELSRLIDQALLNNKK